MGVTSGVSSGVAVGVGVGVGVAVGVGVEHTQLELDSHAAFRHLPVVWPDAILHIRLEGQSLSDEHVSLHAGTGVGVGVLVGVGVGE